MHRETGAMVTTTMTELTHNDDATIVATAVAMNCELRRRTCGPAQIEADTYRGNAPDYRLKAAIHGWQEWTEDAAEQFVADCIDAACSELENNWFQALESIGHPAAEGL